MIVPLQRPILKFIVIALVGVAFADSSSAQISLQQISGGAIEGNLEEYRDISDAVLLFQRGNAQASLKMLQEIFEQNSALPPGEVMFAHLCFASKNVKPGIAALQSCVVQHANDPEAWNMLADLQLRQGQLAEAELIFDNARKVAESFSGTQKRKQIQLKNALAGLARSHELRNLWAEAEPYLTQWLKIDAENPNAYRRLATAQLNLEQFEEAQRTLDTLREIDPDQLPSEVTIGSIYQSLGKTDEAADSMAKALKKYGDDFDTRIAVARWALEAGELELVRSCADKAATLDADSFMPTLLLATTSLMERHYEEAEKLFRSVYDKKPGNFDAVNGLATTLLAQPQPEKHQQGLELARVIAQGNRDLRTGRGRQSAALFAWGLHRTGSTEDAFKLIQPVVVSGQITPDIGYYTAKIFADSGQKDLAIDVLNKALESSTRFAFGDESQELLKSLQTE